MFSHLRHKHYSQLPSKLFLRKFEGICFYQRWKSSTTFVVNLSEFASSWNDSKLQFLFDISISRRTLQLWRTRESLWIFSLPPFNGFCFTTTTYLRSENSYVCNHHFGPLYSCDARSVWRREVWYVEKYRSGLPVVTLLVLCPSSVEIDDRIYVLCRKIIEPQNDIYSSPAN